MYYSPLAKKTAISGDYPYIYHGVMEYDIDGTIGNSPFEKHDSVLVVIAKHPDSDEYQAFVTDDKLRKDIIMDLDKAEKYIHLLGKKTDTKYVPKDIVAKIYNLHNDRVF